MGKERTNEEALELFADLLEPVAEILTDPEIVGIWKSGGKKVTLVSKAIKNHKHTIVKILSLIDGIPEEEYKVNVLTLPARVLKLLNSPMFQELFTSQGQETTAGSSGSAMANTEGGVN